MHTARLAIPLVLILTATLLGGGLPLVTASAQQEAPAPAAPEPPASRLPYDEPLRVPRLPTVEGAAAAPEAPQTPLAPEYASWSQLTFQSARNAHDWEVYRANGDGANQVNISNHGSMDIHPRLNRGATHITFASNRDGNYEIYVMNADGSGQARRTYDGASDVYPAWSPDGSQIAFQSYRDGNQAEIYVMNADGSGLRRLTYHGDYDGEPAWSPDGTQIAFTRRSSDQYRIWVMYADGGNLRQLSHQPNSENPAWSPDGSRIAYDADGDGDGWQELWLMDASGGNQRQVYDPGYQTDAWARSWSPDGRYVAFTRISFIQQGGNWYWTYAYLDAWDAQNTWSTTRLSGNGADWYPDWQTTDIWPPTSNVLPLPVESPAPFTVSWSGTDSGPSGIANYDIQVKDGPGGVWTDWLVATTSLSAPYAGMGGHTYCFRSRARDNGGNAEPWSADCDTQTTVEALPPWTFITPLPAFSQSSVSLHWGGGDLGGSGIRSYDVQYRQGAGVWTDWRMGTTKTSAIFNSSSGVEYGFRVRGTDNAGNQEAWRANNAANTSTTLYAWHVTGRLTDNRGYPIGHAPLSITPSPVLTAQTDALGDYTAYLLDGGNHTLTVNRPGYGALAVPVLAVNQNRKLDLYLPPAQNWITNGGFENGASLPLAWTLQGPSDATAISADGHTDARALVMGRACPYPCIARSRQITSASSVDLASDSHGNLHLTWMDGDGVKQQVRYAIRFPDGSWTSPENLGTVDPYTVRSTGIAVDGRDVVHVVWEGADGLYYRYRAPGAGWSTTAQLVSNASSMDIAADYLGGVHIVYYVWEWALNSRSIRYLECLPSGDWQAPVVLDSDDGGGGPGVAVGPDASVHFIYQDTKYGEEGVFYRWRPHGSETRPAERLWSGFARSRYRQNLAVSHDDTVHAVFHWGGNHYHTYRPVNGAWSAPAPIGDSGSPAIAVDSRGTLHVVGLQGYGPYSLYYRTRTTDGSWGIPVVLGESYTPEPALIIDPQDEVHFTSYMMGPTPGSYYWTSLAATSSDSFTVTASQQLTIPAGMHRPTVAANYIAKGEGHPLSISVEDSASTTEVFSATATSAWELAHADLSPWAGRQVTITFILRQEADTPYVRAWIDDVTLGDWPTPVSVSVDPPRADAWTATPIVIRGENFINKPTVRIGPVEAEDVTWSDEQTLQAIVPATLGPGTHDLWVTNPNGAASVRTGAFQSGKPIYLPVITR